MATYIASTGSRPGNLDALLKSVISLNRRRIFCRLRSHHASFSRKAKGKPTLLDRLRVAQDLLQYPTLAQAVRQDLSGEIDELQRYFSQLEEMATEQALSPASDTCLFFLVKGLNTLAQHEQTLKQVPYRPGRWTTQDTASLLDRVRKSGHYVDACKELLRAARRYTIFSKISVNLVDSRSPCAAVSNPSLVMEQAVPTELLSQVANHLGISVENVQERATDVLKKRSTIHAEMQLALFYEFNTQLRQPRVICSSKSACYLCYLFLALQGTYVVPSTHGRLYTSWKCPGSDAVKPNMPGLQQLLPRLVNSVERELQESIHKKAARRSDPVESIIHLPVMTPSCPSVYSSRISTEKGLAVPLRVDASKSACTLSGDVMKLDRAIPAEGDISKTVADEDRKKTIDMRDHLCECSSSTCGSRHSNATQSARTIRIRRGQGVVRTFTTANRTSQVQAANINLHLECDISTFGEDQGMDKLHLRLDCLDTEHAGKGASNLIQLESDWDNAPVMDGILFTPSGLLLQRGTTLLQLRAIK